MTENKYTVIASQETHGTQVFSATVHRTDSGERFIHAGLFGISRTYKESGNRFALIAKSDRDALVHFLGSLARPAKLVAMQS